MTKREINFEVHVQQKGRWEIHARYPNERREAAIEEADALAKMPGIDDVKVIRESYNPADGTARETVIHRGTGGRAKASKAKPASMRSPSSSWSSSDRDDEFWDTAEVSGNKSRTARSKARRKKAKKETSAGIVLIKILLIILFGIALASIAAGISISFLDRPRFMSFLGTTVRTYILFGVFIFTFLITAGPMIHSSLSSTNLAVKKKPRRPLSAPESYRGKSLSPADEAGGKKEAESPGDISSDADEAARAAADALHRARKEEEEKEKEEEEDESPERESAEETQIPPLEPAAAEEILTIEEDEPVPPDQPPEEQTERPLSSFAEKQRIALLKFFGEALEQIPPEKRNFDTFNKFGVSLYIAGACEGLCQKRNLDPRSASRILTGAAEVLGYEKADAARFADKYENYLVSDSRYMQMFQSGRNSMIIAIEEGAAANPGKLLDNALTDWNTPKAKEDKTGPITVMFTDMVGSTALTQTMGDAVAQQVVRAHNRVVREALAQYGGKEVKHTGDGIMASFSTTSNGVEAAMDIQRGTEKHNRNNPDLPLKIKIGINAGEPIAEDNDLFGTTVQLSARIVDKAKADQIFVSDIVRGICAGKDIEFKSMGPFELKGFKGGVPIYEVIWRPAGGEQEPA
jgi:adenylate cyclase